jgi:hypothetical protein
MNKMKSPAKGSNAKDAAVAFARRGRRFVLLLLGLWDSAACASSPAGSATGSLVMLSFVFTVVPRRFCMVVMMMMMMMIVWWDCNTDVCNGMPFSSEDPKFLRSTKYSRHIATPQ